MDYADGTRVLVNPIRSPNKLVSVKVENCIFPDTILNLYDFADGITNYIQYSTDGWVSIQEIALPPGNYSPLEITQQLTEIFTTQLGLLDAGAIEIWPNPASQLMIVRLYGTRIRALPSFGIRLLPTLINPPYAGRVSLFGEVLGWRLPDAPAEVNVVNGAYNSAVSPTSGNIDYLGNLIKVSLSGDISGGGGGQSLVNGVSSGFIFLLIPSSKTQQGNLYAIQYPSSSPVVLASTNYIRTISLEFSTEKGKRMLLGANGSVAVQLLITPL